MYYHEADQEPTYTSAQELMKKANPLLRYESTPQPTADEFLKAARVVLHKLENYQLTIPEALVALEEVIREEWNK